MRGSSSASKPCQGRSFACMTIAVASLSVLVLVVLFTGGRATTLLPSLAPSTFSLPHASHDLNLTNWNDTLGALPDDQWCIVEFYAGWCPHCREFAPTYDRVANFLQRHGAPQPPGSNGSLASSPLGTYVFVGRVDCATEPLLCQRFSVAFYPSMTAGQAGTYRRAGNVTLYPAAQQRTEAAIVRWVGQLMNKTLKYTAPVTDPPAAAAAAGGSSPGHQARLHDPAHLVWHVRDVEGATLQLWAMMTAAGGQLLRGPGKRQVMLDLVGGQDPTPPHPTPPHPTPPHPTPPHPTPPHPTPPHPTPPHPTPPHPTPPHPTPPPPHPTPPHPTPPHPTPPHPTPPHPTPPHPTPPHPTPPHPHPTPPHPTPPHPTPPHPTPPHPTPPHPTPPQVRWWAAGHASSRCQAGAQKLVAFASVLWPEPADTGGLGASSPPPDAILQYKICGPHAPEWVDRPGSWRTCRGSVPGSRGFTCGLWLLFHTSAARQILAQPEVDALVTQKEAVMWLWHTHNKGLPRAEATAGHHRGVGGGGGGRERGSQGQVAWEEEAVYQYLSRVFGAEPRQGWPDEGEPRQLRGGGRRSLLVPPAHILAVKRGMKSTAVRGSSRQLGFRDIVNDSGLEGEAPAGAGPRFWLWVAMWAGAVLVALVALLRALPRRQLPQPSNLWDCEGLRPLRGTAAPHMARVAGGGALAGIAGRVSAAARRPLAVAM
ncbi:hypothetical protein QJQ45_024163 [Haematococcus lacustris]|nr:hypothetical protein QJQ45_024163 [Haematococcus lacustris]